MIHPALCHLSLLKLELDWGLVPQHRQSDPCAVLDGGPVDLRSLLYSILTRTCWVMASKQATNKDPLLQEHGLCRDEREVIVIT